MVLLEKLFDWFATIAAQVVGASGAGANEAFAIEALVCIGCDRLRKECDADFPLLVIGDGQAIVRFCVEHGAGDESMKLGCEFLICDLFWLVL